ncbi:MAG: hypothetical protein GX220_04590 [Treponema sp.]|nr:hypothetical protein [Treponema sp.]
MNMKKKIVFFITFGIFFLVIYLCLATLNMKEELQLSPKWTVDLLEDLSTMQKDETGVFQLVNSEIFLDEQLIPFKLGQNFGYFTQEGKVASFQTFPFKVSISSSFFTIFSNDSVIHTIFKKNGKEQCKIFSSGFPFIEDERIYIFAPGGSIVSSFNIEGKQNWRYESYVPIVAFRSSEGACVVGLADGSLLHFKNDQTEPTFFVPGGSNYQIILGADVSKSGELVACVSGLEKQRFVVSRILDGQSKILFHEYLTGELTEQTFVKFAYAHSDLEAVVFFQHADGLGIFSLEELKIHNINLEGKILSVAFSPQKKYVFVLSKIDENTFSIYMINNYYQLVGSVRFDAEYAFLHTQNNSLYIGKNFSISRFDLMIK